MPEEPRSEEELPERLPRSELDQILKDHKQWLETKKTDERKADLSGAHLEGADLAGVYLQGASLWNAHLQRADLLGVELQSGAASWASSMPRRAQICSDIGRSALSGATERRSVIRLASYWS